MQILFTGAAKHWGVQTDPSKSLGGYVSSSLVPNGALNNLFPAINKDDVVRDLKKTRLIVLKTSLQMTNVRIWTESAMFATNYIACVQPAMVNNEPVFEQVPNEFSIPYQAVLVAAEGEDNYINVGDVAANTYIGIWIRRQVNTADFTQLDGLPGIEQLTDTELEELIDNQTGIDECQCQVIIDWQ
jgi:hypothetical protein